ncbi:sporulation protein [Actinokineospora sp. NBRC 105648]|uniref:sporulation protein n=1 Tax=Actinokineospora sp. NBRC 105648 TaxID=3032206 RepID=UPI0024A25AB1|nr:sporulation protein [Actinokineospora sp. NBRC 105648]GLZ37701.1 MFS transporter [Actinokineospora sp. NBRC 105648]
MPRSEQSASKPNTLLGSLITQSGASSKSLAMRVNQLAAGVDKRTAYTHTSVANWTRRGIMPEPVIRSLIAQALGERLGRPVTLAEIGMRVEDIDLDVGLAFPHELPLAVRGATHYWSVVDRRDFLATTGLTMAGWATPIRRWLTSPADPHAAQVGATRHVGAADVADLLAAADDARRWDSRLGGGNWRSSAVVDCLREQATPLLHGRYTDRTGRQLFAATAQLSRLAGWTAFDTGRHAAAQRHYIQALRLARAAGDVPFGGYVLVCAALQASLRGFHDDAIDMCLGAFERAKTTATPRVLAFFKLIEARAHARAGSARAAGRALSTSDLLIRRADRETGDDPDWIDFYTHSRLAADAVEVHRDLGLPAPARRWDAEAAIPVDAFARSHGLRLIVVASTHLQGAAPDLAAALHHGNRAVDVLTRVASARAVDYARDLVDRCLPWKDEAGVVDLARRIRTDLTAVA